MPNLRVGAGWVHATLPLNRLGRTSANPPKLSADGEPIEDKSAPPPPPVLKSLAGEAADFNIRPCHESGDAAGGLISVRSLRWPGAVTVGSSMKRYVAFYAGCARASWCSHAPPPPPRIGLTRAPAAARAGTGCPSCRRRSSPRRPRHSRPSTRRVRYAYGCPVWAAH